MAQEFPHSDKNMLLLKNPQFLPDHYETLSKEGTHENLILTKFRNDPVKIVNFSFFDRVRKLLGHSVRTR